MKSHVRQPLFSPKRSSTANRRQSEVMVAFIDQYRAVYGVEPICKELPIAPSTYYNHKALKQQPEKRSIRARRDDFLLGEIQRAWEESHRN